MSHGRTFLHGLSDFWLKFFRDVGDLEALYEGTAVVLGQAYLDLMSDVLNTSIDTVPLFRKELYSLLPLREDQIRYENGSYVADLPDTFVSIPVLQNKIFSPTAALEEAQDYVVNQGTIAFTTDPTSPVLPGYASRRLDVAIGGAFTGTFANTIRKGDTLLVGGHRYLLVGVSATKVYLSTTTPIATEDLTGHEWVIEQAGTVVDSGSGGEFIAERTHRVYETTFWAADASVDQYALYENFGYLFGDKRASSEAYRAFLKGMMQLYQLGPALGRVESALNAVAGLPLIRDDGEVLRAYHDGIDGSGDAGVLVGDIFTDDLANFALGGSITLSGTYHAANTGTFVIAEILSPTSVRLLHPDAVDENTLTWVHSQKGVHTVTTSAQRYTIPRALDIRADILDSNNIGVLTFQAFEPLTAAIRVTDYIRDPTWWHDKTLPQRLLPGRVAGERFATPALYPNVAGATNGGALAGDPGLYAGADEFGEVLNEPIIYRHCAAYILVDRFLKAHIFAVRLAPEIDLRGTLIMDMRELIQTVKPTYTTAYFGATSSFEDLVVLQDVFDLRAKMAIDVEVVAEIDNTLRAGTDWLAGDNFHYTMSHGGEIDIGTTPAHIPLVAGGLDPLITEGLPADGISYFIDRPLYVNTRSA